MKNARNLKVMILLTFFALLAAACAPEDLSALEISGSSEVEGQSFEAETDDVDDEGESDLDEPDDDDSEVIDDEDDVDEDESDDDSLELRGVVEALDGGIITINGQVFTLGEAFNLDGVDLIGGEVEIKFVVAEDGSLIIIEFEIEDEADDEEDLEDDEDDLDEDAEEPDEEEEFSGNVTAIGDGTIEVDGTVIVLTEDTEFEGEFTVGSEVKVKFIVGDHGTLIAAEVEVEDDLDEDEEDFDEDEGDEDDDEEDVDDEDDDGDEDDSEDDDDDDDDD